MPRKINSAFEASVLTHLEYIKKKQDEHDDRFNSIEAGIKIQNDKCTQEMRCVNTRLDKAEGMVKGGAVVGSVAGGILGFFASFFR